MHALLLSGLQRFQQGQLDNVYKMVAMTWTPSYLVSFSYKTTNVSPGNHLISFPWQASAMTA
eukprot:1638944-Amphidinium_carterae.1